MPVDLKGATAAHYRGMAETFAQQFGRLDGVLFNAGLLGTLSPFGTHSGAGVGRGDAGQRQIPNSC